MRAFLAVQLPTVLRDALVCVHADLVSEDAGWAQASWVAPQNLHITVQFLGDVEEEDAERLCILLRPRLACETRPVLDVTGLHSEPRASRARMLWATVNDAELRLTRVAAIVETAVAEVGFQSPAHRFRPHVTLARARHPMCASEQALRFAEERLLGLKPGDGRTMSVPCITLVHSTLTRHGPIYRIMAEIPIGID